jgi:hypothetical protein
MDTLSFLFFVLGIGYWAYRNGKREGSKAGFHVGWKRRNRRR